jgi:hypothetical protein
MDIRAQIQKILLMEDRKTDVIVGKIGLPTPIAEWIISSFDEKFQFLFATNSKKRL